MKRLLFLTLLCLGVSSLTAQSNNPGWDKFSCPRFGFIISYPDAWNMSETGNGVYRFKNENQQRGAFYMEVREFTDSSEAQIFVKGLNNEVSGAKLDSSNGRTLLTYRIMRITSGERMETHYWVLSFQNRVYLCHYDFKAVQRNDAGIVEDMILAYQTFESIRFIEE